MNNQDSLDLLDLEDDAGVEELVATSPFDTPRPKKPWLLLGLGLLIIALATYIIIRAVGSGSDDTIDVDLDVPAESVDNAAVPVVDVPIATPSVDAKPATSEPVNVTPGAPQRVVEDKKPVTFDPDKNVTVKPKPVTKPAPVVKKTTQTKVAAGSWYVQFGSYSTRAAAESAQKKIGATHVGLFSGKQFVILAAQLPNGTTTYRLRIAFASQNEANGFCRNAKSDGLDCYVAK